MPTEPGKGTKELSIEPWERVVVTAADHWHPVELVEVDKVISGGECRVVLGCQGERALDLLCEDARGVRWWAVEDWCRGEGANTVPIYYDGAFVEIPKALLDGEKGAYVFIRRVRRGPWMQTRGPDDVNNHTADLVTPLQAMSPLKEKTDATDA